MSQKIGRRGKGKIGGETATAARTRYWTRYRGHIRALGTFHMYALLIRLLLWAVSDRGGLETSRSNRLEHGTLTSEMFFLCSNLLTQSRQDKIRTKIEHTLPRLSTISSWTNAPGQYYGRSILGKSTVLWRISHRLPANLKAATENRATSARTGLRGVHTHDLIVADGEMDSSSVPNQ